VCATPRGGRQNPDRSTIALPEQISLFKYPTRGLESVSVSKAIKVYARLVARSAVLCFGEVQVMLILDNNR